jgi:nucleoside triphosphate diphosphatase
MPETTFQDLVELVARLRAPGGCPWDREQTYATLGPMLVEEAYEVIDAADSGDWNELRDELGDILFQILFYCQIATEEDHFNIDQTIARVHEKMTRRHPHVFGSATAETAAEVLVNWEAIKAEERKTSGKKDDKGESLLNGVSSKLPALFEAYQLTTKAARVGFDWERIEDVFAKLQEELAEVRAEIARPERIQAAVADEIGDLLFVVTNIARQAGVEPELALKSANRKFRRRFHHVETRLRERGSSCGESTLAEMDALWNEAKEIERRPE